MTAEGHRRLAAASVGLAVVGPGLAMLGALLTAPPAGRTVTRLRRTLLCFGVLAGGSMLAILWSPIGQRILEGLVVSSAIGVTGTALAGAALFVVRRVDAIRQQRRPESLPSSVTIAITCPRCGVEGRRPTGLSRCSACAAPLLIDLLEPRCECGYVVYRLEQAVCPECGRAL
jgi:hypothetical protein